MMRQLLKQHGGKMLSTVGFPQDQPDLLDPEALQPMAAGHSGFPEATDGLAYEPVQRLLAVCCLPTLPHIYLPPTTSYQQTGAVQSLKSLSTNLAYITKCVNSCQGSCWLRQTLRKCKCSGDFTVIKFRGPLF